MYQRPAWVEINLAAIRENVKQIKSLVKPETKCCAVVKADGYGHGVIPVAKSVIDAGADYLAVATLTEAMELRQAGFIVPILILGYTPDYQMPLIIAYNIRPTICSIETAEALSKVAQQVGLTVKFHLKIDTGMGRIGILPSQVGDFIEKLSHIPNIELEGVFSHFAKADAKDKSFAYEQFNRFMTALENITAHNITPQVRHMAASAALVDMPETHYDMVRMGIIMYGIWPSEYVKKRIQLQPAMKFKCRVAFVKEVPAGTTISYGCTYVTSKPSKIATLPVGYADGWNRALSNKGQVLVHNCLAPIVGRICMDQCMIDVTHIANVKVGDEVVLFGEGQVPIEKVAAQLETIPYEVMCGIGKRVPRIYTLG